MDIALNVNESEFWSILIENPLYIKGLFFDNPFSLTKKVSKCGGGNVVDETEYGVKGVHGSECGGKGVDYF